jgi:pimeloyl-ACP methyl ester carboxylesterase
MTSTAEVDGATLSYSDIGGGFPLLCLHGGMGVDGQTLHVPGVLNLADHGIRLIIPDQRGHGQSSRSSEAKYTHAIWAADVRSLARHLGLSKFALLGHSYGGFIALEYAVRWADSLTHLVLVATSAGPVSARSAAVAADAELREYFRGIWPLFFVGENKHLELFERAGFSAEPYNAAFKRELPAYNLRERVKDLKVPMLLIVGSTDPYRAHLEWLAENTPSATLYVIEGVGHFPFIEASVDFERQVASFLTGHVEPAA